MSFDFSYAALILGLIIVIMVLLRQIGQRRGQYEQKQKQREAVLRAAQEAERKSQIQTAMPKSQVLSSKTRIPLADPYGTPFTGVIQGKAAKWEAEIHQLGRQIIGQIDSKMAALQAITLDANRTANRLEILVEHLEQIARQQVEREQNQNTQGTGAESAAEESPTVITAAKSVSEAAPLTNVLKELADDLEGLHSTIKQSATFREQPESATVLRVAEQQVNVPAADSSVNIRHEAVMLANYGVAPQDIARQLNISLGEVDLILQVQQNRSDRLS